MSKNTFEKIAADQLTDPSHDPESDEKKSLQDIDFTEPGQADVSPSGRKVLGAYLSQYVTKGRHADGNNNQFYPPKKGSDVSSYKRGGVIHSPNPDSSGINVDTDGRQFYPQDETGLLASTGLGVPKGNNENKLGTFFKSEQLSKMLDKSGGNENLSGHDLLRDMPTSPPNTSPQPGTYLDYVVTQLREANLYHPTKDSPFVKDPNDKNEEKATQGLFTIQRDLGSFVVNEGAGLDSASGTRVKVSDMSRMALALLAQATGDYAAAGSVLSHTDATIISTLRSLQNPIEQIGIQGVPISKLRLNGLVTDISSDKMQKIIKAARGGSDFIETKSQRSLTDRGIAASNDGQHFQSSPYNSVSHAQLNSFLEPFGDIFGSVGMLTIAVEGIRALLAVTAALSTFSKGASKSQLAGHILPSQPAGYAFGRHTGKESSIGLDDTLYNLLRITDTDYDFDDCVETGILLLLGFEPDLGITEMKNVLNNPTALGAFAMNLALSPSYYANMLRQIVRDASDVTAGFKGIGGTFGLTSMVSAIEKTVRSKAYRFVMIAAGVGDAALKSFYGQLDVGGKSEYHNEELPMPTAKNHERVETRGQTSRWQGGKNTLSLTTFLASDVSSTGGTFRRQKDLTPNGVREIESKLDAEYMPFYFHDLRTHEVMSLPAFVTQFDEGFNATYNNLAGYGRQDSVKIYEGTERTMTFAFKLVSFNEDDFDEMWYLVNKLTAMCYPQYSKGRQRQYESNDLTYKFIQPFSQIPAASPVIRLRLGDVLKSNYSKSDLIRQFELNVNNIRPYQEAYKAAVKSAKLKLKKSIETKIENGDLDWIAAYGQLANPDTSRIIMNAKGSTGARRGKAAVNVPSKVAGGLASVRAAVKVRDARKTSFATNDIIKIWAYNKEIRIARVGKDASSSVWVKISVADVTIDTARIESAQLDGDEDVKKAKNDLDAAKNANGIKGTEGSSFFASSNNAIVRSFESTRGKGMAGVITSLQFSYGTYPWEIKKGSRAPMMIDVALGFSPIHDLPLGLDYNGQLRAPSHPVGKFSGEAKTGGVYGEHSDDNGNGI